MYTRTQPSFFSISLLLRQTRRRPYLTFAQCNFFDFESFTIPNLSFQTPPTLSSKPRFGLLPTTMNTLPAKMADSLSLIRTFATFPSSHLGSSNYGIVSFLQRNRGSRVSFLKTDWSLEKCCMRVENCLQALRPASEAFAQEATDALKAGKVIAVPTDTLYGLACDACSAEAVHRIYEIKGRKLTSPLAICVGGVSDITRYAITDHLPSGLLDSLLPGPVTVVLKRGESSVLDKSLNPGLDSIGVRVPDADFIRLISRRSETALALTSANLSGQPSSVCVNDFENLWQHCAYVYDGGVLPAGRAGSTIVDLTERGTFKIIRAGSAEKQTIATLQRYSLLEAAATI